MKYKSSFTNRINECEKSRAKMFFFGFVLILAFVFLFLNTMKVGAIETEIIGTKFDKNDDGAIHETDESFIKVDLSSGSDKLTFIQANGNDDEVAIMFNVSDFPKEATSFMIVESEKTDSSSTADADRYSKVLGTDGDGNTVWQWVASDKNVTKNGITGSAIFSEEADGTINAEIVYRLRKGSFGMKFLRMYFYNAGTIETNPSGQHDVYYVVSRPIDMVAQSADNCTAKSSTEICIGYDADADTSRISRELKIYIPQSVAYKFNVIPLTWVFDATVGTEIVANETEVKNGSTIYGINYFNETASGEVTPAVDKANAQRKYMYTNFTMSGVDSQGKTTEFITTGNSNYTLYLDAKFNEVDYILTKVDSVGAFTYYLKDIFGNIKEITQDVDNVKNRAIITEVKKGNADDDGYGATETFTNESVKVELTMTVETHFEFGICIDAEKCTKIINLTKDDVKQVKYWRVDVVIGTGGYDRDAYQEGDLPSKDYASEDYAVSGSMKNVYCKTTEYCTGAEIFDANKINEEDGFGFYSFDGNVLAMYIGVNGRYRYYIEDVYGNNSWGTDGDRLEEEYRNPRVEVYAIDKAAPEIVFEHDDEQNVSGENLKMFDIETYSYYTGIELAPVSGVFEYDGRIKDTTDAVERNITSQIYYPINRDEGRAADDKFTNDDAVVMSQVRALEYVYYYDGTKDLYADYSVYDRAGSDYYVKKLYSGSFYDNSINTIFKNTKNNSNGLKLDGGEFSFKEINYYHNDGIDRVCTQIASITGYDDYASKAELDCVNYYIDHGVDFIIEFVAEDYVGNLGKNRVYVNLVDTTPPGLTLHTVDNGGTPVVDETKLMKASNIGTKCRMEIGQEIGSGKVQNMAMLLNCYNIDVNETVADTNTYNFEDNLYDITVDDGLSFFNRINGNISGAVSHVKLFILSDRVDGEGRPVWVDLSSQTFIPNKTGYYDLKFVIYDNTIEQTGTNSLTILTSYYVDRKIVLIEPIATNKYYGSADPGFNYCVYIDIDNHYEIRFSNNPYSDPTIFTKIYCTNQTSDEINAGKNKLFRSNESSDFYGEMSRLESSWYNSNLASPNLVTGTSVGVENNYVGLYRFILGTLNINLKADETSQDPDYVVKIHPTYRDNTKYSNSGTPSENDNLITNQMLEDDDKFSQSNVDFTIRQIILNIMANGGEKNYGELDTNSNNYNSDAAESKYLNGYSEKILEGESSSLKYNDTLDIVLGVVRREVGENVGLYKICNYREKTNADNVLENPNNMYVGCIDMTSSGIVFNDSASNFEGYTYNKGIIVIDEAYINSRALYIATNKKVAGRSLNATTDVRNNKYANYVINYTEGEYIINSIDLVLQAAPGQRREYNFTNTYDPNPWEIILYGLVDGNIKRIPADEDEPDAVVEFNGYTANIIDGEYYDAEPNEKETAGGSEASKIPANFSEERDNWYLYHNGEQLVGYKTNETYKLLRNAAYGSSAGSAKLVREPGKDGGWYLYYSLSSDLNVITGGTITGAQSAIAVMTNGREQCSYDTTGHIVTVDGTVMCKNYNLIYNPYYTNEAGYTIDNNPNGLPANDFIYKSNDESCLTLDEDLPCANTGAEPQKIYKILFEIYRREIIMEFNSAIETIRLSDALSWDVFYGKRYNFYKTNYLDVAFYNTYNANNTNDLYPEDYLFLCYQNETTMARAEFDPENASSTGCTGDYRYGLTAGDSWTNIGLFFKMHEAVSATTSDYYDDEDFAIPAGAYYVYADIAEEQKRNYNFKYLGGALTIKSLAVEVEITSYTKEYGEKYYSKYGLGDDYDSFDTFANGCLLDGWFITAGTNLNSLPTGTYCTDASVDYENSYKNIYGFHINGLDAMDSISGNFNGVPTRSRSVSLAADANGLQDNVGTYNLTKGSIKTINNNPFVNADNACEDQIVKGDYGDCVVVANKLINNYVIAGENRVYTFDMQTTVEEEKDVDVLTPVYDIKNGKLFITPATLTITVTTGQTKMYGCAYNEFNNTSTNYSYDYLTGYSNCVEGDGNYYDLGYKYKVSGDKDYQIARNGYEYATDDVYEVSGLVTDDTFRPTTVSNGIKAHALNNGTLYRIKDTTANRAAVKMSSYVSAAISSQQAVGGASKKYQDQTVGNYILTLGNVDATKNEAKETYVNSCDANNMPGVGSGYTFVCKNYDINYYGTKVYEESVDVDQTYTKEGSFPTELLFTITKRKAYVYTKYDQKIYGEADMYNDPNLSVVYLCGDNNMDGSVDADDNVTLEGGVVVNLDVHYGFCSQEQVDANTDLDGTNNSYIEYGLTRYYTKYNSLAKAPWNGIEGRNDVQTDVIAGKISRKGMNGGAPTTDDIKGLYDYVYEDANFYGTVHLIGSAAEDNDKYASTYGYDNYLVNYYEDGKAVNEDGESVEDDADLTPIKYEIVLRQIKIAFVSFDKVYGEKDAVDNYNILVCAPSEEFDFENMKCINKDPNDKHGLSASHISRYTTGGILNQELFKEEFVVRFMRVLGENVSCGTSTNVTVNLTGYFYGTSDEVDAEGLTYTKVLKCNTTAVEGKSVYETLAYIEQAYNTVPGFNYKVSYQIGHVNIVPRPILITPDSGQGFMYGDYHNSLIPSITFKDSVVRVAGDGIVQTYGLVHDSTAGSELGICLNNINYYNNGTINGVDVGTCFYINDRMDEYSSDNNMATSSYDSGAVNSNTGLANVNIKNYVFGDAYSSESSVRSALDRKMSLTENTRYNRNVGVYEITMGDLADKTGNYSLSFAEGVTYEIKSAKVTVTPDNVSVEDNVSETTQTGQYKVYGEKDKELTFQVVTSYTVTKSYYTIKDSNIIKIVSVGNVTKTLTQLDTFDYNADTMTFTKNDLGTGTYIYLAEGDTVHISGFAYGENNGTIRNYGKAESGLKANVEESVNQGSVTGSLYFDTVCKDATEGCNADRTLSYGETSRILLGYLYVDGWSQAAGVYNIVNGMLVAVNEWNNHNYGLEFVEGVKFTIIPRPVGVQIENVVKTYGQTTDVVSCEFVDGAMLSPCVNEAGILMTGNTLLRNNFSVEYFEGMTKLESILNNYSFDGGTYNNSKLYSQNSKFANGLVPEEQKAYSVYGVAENKNTEQLGVYVSRDERNTTNAACLYSGDTYGFCEDAGTYYLRFYGYLNTIDSITANNYQSAYRPEQPASGHYTGPATGVEKYYYDTYFGYNPNYFVIVLDNDADETAITSENLFTTSHPSTSRVQDATDPYEFDNMLKATGTLTINKKSVALYVNTSYFTEGLEIYYVGQNTNAPALPLIDNSIDLDYNLFNGIGGPEADRETAVSGTDSYAKIIWGTQPSQVRRGDKLAGELAYCNTIITADAYDVLRSDGLLTDYSCLDLVYNDNKDQVNTNLIGYVPIVRNTNLLSIVNESTSSANKTYEESNYAVIFYPGALRIEEDDIKPIVEVNRKDVYLEANAIGTYMYECVGGQTTTTYVNCGPGISIVGKTENTEGDPILNWLNNNVNYDSVIKVDLPLIAECETNEYDCTSTAYFELEHGKGNSEFTTSGGILPNTENDFVYPFTMQKDEYVKNAGPNSLKELIITLVNWFGVSAYDQGEIRNGEALDKKFDKYWYIVIEKQGTNGIFDISKVGDYKVHFYVMDNAGNVSNGNMYEVIDEKDVLQTTYKNVGTLHIVDTTKPVVGTINLYNGRVKCTVPDCTKEENWIVAEDTYLPINTLLRYDSEGNAVGNGAYVDIGAATLANLSTLTKYSRVTNASLGFDYVEDASQGKYVLIPEGNNARALKHYSWNNSPSGIHLTITGGSDNSYTEVEFDPKNVKDYSQWNHYFSRDGGITWFLFDKAKGESYLVLDSEGSREILIKAVDSGVKITSATEVTVSYVDKYYGDGQAANTTATMTTYNFVDTSQYDKILIDFEDLTIEEQKLRDAERNAALANIGWNVSEAATNDATKAEQISQLIYGKPAEGEVGVASMYKFFRDKRTAYLDRTSPIINFGRDNGEKLYVYEYGCRTEGMCDTGYTEYYAGAVDSYPEDYDDSSEIKSTTFDKNHSILVNHYLYESTKNEPGTLYQESYADVSQEKPGVKQDVGGLGSDAYAMNGGIAGLDIRNVYSEERRYIIYAFDEDNNKQTFDLSSSIPTSIDTTTGEDSIYAVIKKDPSAYLTTGDYTYTIIYSVFDKAGNESIYIARGVIYASLIPQIEIANAGLVVDADEPNAYSLTVEQGDDVKNIVNSLAVTAGDKKHFLTQTIYYNGELVVDNKKYNENIWDEFTTSVPGVYEITYNLQYMYHSSDGRSELIEAEPMKLTIVVEATPPVVETSAQTHSSYIIAVIGLLIASLGVCWFSLVSKRKN